MSNLHKRSAMPKFESVSGSLEEVRERMGKLGHLNFITFAYEPTEQVDTTAITEFVKNAIGVAGRHMNEKNAQQIDALLHALTPEIRRPESWLEEVEETIAARKDVIDNGVWLTAADVAKAAGFSMKNPSSQPNKWKQDGQIFTIKNQGTEYFPGYGLDPALQYRPTKALAAIISIFKDKKDGWEMAYWFVSANGVLGGLPPQDLLISNPEDVIAAAKHEMAALEGDTHG